MNFNSMDAIQKISKNHEAIQELFKKASADLVEFNKGFRERLVTPGTFLDVKDNSNKWRLAWVISVENKIAKIRFDAWSTKWDEVDRVFLI